MAGAGVSPGGEGASQVSQALRVPDVQMRLEHHNPGDLQPRLLHCVTAWLRRWRYADLTAPYWRLYVLSGRGAVVRHGGRTIALDPRSAWLIAPDTPFGADLTGPGVRQCYVHFTLAPGFSASPGVYPVRLDATLRALHRRASGAAAPGVAGGGGDGGAAQVVAWHALVLLALAGLPAGVLREHSVDARVQRVLEHIERDPGGPHTLAELAHVAGMHARALIRLFRSETGTTPMSCLRVRRIALACDLLHHSDRSIDDIAALSGFCDRYHFTKTFTRLRRVSPGAFRVRQNVVGVA